MYTYHAYYSLFQVILYATAGCFMFLLLFVGLPYFVVLIHDEVVGLLSDDRERRRKIEKDDDDFFTKLIEQQKHYWPKDVANSEKEADDNPSEQNVTDVSRRINVFSRIRAYIRRLNKPYSDEYQPKHRKSKAKSQRIKNYKATPIRI